MEFSSRTGLARIGGAVALAALVAGCSQPLDFDMRGQIGAFNTSDAARNITTERPEPDSRGVISYPNYQMAVARRGDTVADVANRVGLSPEAVARYNGLDPTIPLRAGEIVALPSRVAEPSAATGAVDIATLAGSAIDSAPDTSPVQTSTLEPAATRPAPTVVSTPNPEPVRHKVARGETAYTISRLYQVPVKSLAEWNGLDSDFTIREGQYLLIPVVGGTAPQRSGTAAAATAAAVTEPGAGSPTPTPPSAATPLPDEKIDPKPPEPPKTDVGQPSISSNAVMAFPVQGKIIRTYAKGKNDGIDISAAPGTSVTAAAAGSVAAITEDADQIPIVVVRHPDNLLTVYANVDKITVKKGDPVRRGQKLAQLRGGDNAYVHFEVRNGFDSVNPMPYLE
ncbi:LysM peptidoglycan-binding domain-containing M23 family metallopeptidase [Sedimentitalea sp. JM2-8]|uniref:LysM peptidoglycan-binding domain-containing M23 family metallopeptidase n=1 Tax=Sedimentitalea xiamensis TaxID=3050037 RepID=A0ABT7F9Z7_9RHOB|nr:LysM peptidoglycan-binding domain-containing M23 family metallopeptidase [Sedimentitalea xiamensis]MDK3071926.1 LysM peptidoglycan-binding domain-containing M23 family metallopeptidase [Sedimentitalea xiamensis]